MGKKKKCGFAAMDKERVREIAQMGGLAAHRSGNAYTFDSERAKWAGRKGGLAAAAKRRRKKKQLELFRPSHEPVASRGGDGSGSEPV